MSTPIAIIPAQPEHHALILDSFWREYSDCPLARGVPAAVLSGKMQTLLLSPLWRALVATPEGDPGTVLGYLVWRDASTVGWLHTLRFWRGKGVARALLAQAGVSPGVVSCAFLPPNMAQAATARGWTLRFRPYLPDVEMELTARRVADGLVG